MLQRVQSSYANQNALPYKKLCQYLHEGRTLNGLLSLWQIKIQLKLLRAYEY